MFDSEMRHLNKNKKNSLIVTGAPLVALATIIVVVAAGAVNIAVATTATTNSTRSASFMNPIVQETEPLAPMAVSQDGNNVYIVWWSNKSENWEVMFRASNDGVDSFGEKINLRNSTDAESQNA